jgi:hypothetical protein
VACGGLAETQAPTDEGIVRGRCFSHP